MSKAILFFNGNLSDFSRITASLSPTDDIICADGGANYAIEHNITPHVVIGDFDSIHPTVRQTLEAGGSLFIPYPPEKDYTDSELALTYALDKNYAEIIIIGILGDRIDHCMANILHIARLQQSLDSRQKIRIINGNQELTIIHASTTFHTAIQDTFSLIPLQSACTGITTHGLQYPLVNETLPFGTTRGISNVCIAEIIHIELHAGIVLVVHTRN